MRRLATTTGILAVLLASCRFDPDPRDDEGRRVLRVGYLPNVTQAPALVALQSGLLASTLGPDVVIEPVAFTAGPQLIEGLFAGELDVGYVGPNPAINAYQRSHGRAVRIVAGSTSGGAALVVQPEIDRPAELAGSTLGSPALGNTQDVALRTWLHEQGLETTEEGGSVRVKPAAPVDLFQLFQRGDLDGAWVPEPWASRLVLEAGGRVLVDERSRWPGGVFPTTVVIASTVALERRPELVRGFLEAHARAVELLERQPDLARRLVAERLAKDLNAPLPPEVLERSLGQLSFELAPLEPQLRRVAGEAARLGFLESGEIQGLVDRTYLPGAATAGPEPSGEPQPGEARGGP